MSHIAFIGLGRMGRGMAARLLTAGHALVVHNRTPDKAAELVRGGARLAASPRAAADGASAVFVMVSDAPRDLAGLARQKAGPFMKTLLDEAGRARLQRVLGNGTPTADCGQSGAPSCSDAFGAALLQVESVR